MICREYWSGVWSVFGQVLFNLPRDHYPHFQMEMNPLHFRVYSFPHFLGRFLPNT